MGLFEPEEKSNESEAVEIASLLWYDAGQNQK